ncbi:hypothetical protein C4J81_12795 [Deltaproteobacteria bacterium Smac51]|nr:hypothetical protein C4J81_12795 [Deltaproteobacteria bacterium Smac51]
MSKLLKRLSLFFLVSLCVMAAGCREKPWDPEVAVLVNGQPISKGALEKVLELGFHPIVTDNDTKAHGLTLGQILDKLIDEKLILGEAAKVGLTVSDLELDEEAEFYGTAWFGVKPPPAELGEMKEALRNQLLLRKMTERVIKENLSLSADGWRSFWEGWPKEHQVRYRVRVLVIPPVKDEPKIPARQRKELGDIVEYLAKNGLEVLVSDPIWTSGQKISAEEAAAIEEGLAKKLPTKAFRQPESWIIYEPLEVDRGPDEVAQLLRAKAAFEELEGEKAFRNWLAGVRAEADIAINPAYLEISEPPVEAETELE